MMEPQHLEPGAAKPGALGPGTGEPGAVTTRVLRPRRSFPTINLTESEKTKRTTRKEYAKHYRKQIKNNPQLYKMFKECERLRVQNYRDRQTEEAKQRNRELQRERQRQYRLRKKEAENSGPKTPKTRKASEKMRKQWREQKRQQRAQMSRQKKNSINQARRQKYQDKKMKKRSAEIEGQSCSQMEGTPPLDQSAARVRVAKSRYKMKIVESLPADRELKAVVFDAAIKVQTPTTRKIITKKLGMISPDARRRLCSSQSMKESLTHTLKGMQVSRKKRDMARRRTIIYALMSKKKSLKLLKSAGISRKLADKVSNIQKEENWEEFREKRKDSMSSELLNAIWDFYHHNEISSSIPNSRSAIKKDGKVIGRKVMTTTLAAAFTQFKSTNPDLSVGFSTFKRLRPTHILPHTQNKFRECLCEYCINMELKIQAVDRTLVNLGRPDLKLENKYKLSDMTLCAKQADQYHAKKCIDRKCDQCGTQLVKDHLRVMPQTQPVNWYRWQQGCIGGLQRTMKTEKEGTCEALITELCKELDTFSYHLFNAKWQYQQYKNVTSDIPEETVVMCMDYGENYTCKAQDAPQGYHWTNTQCTIHPIVATYTCPQPQCPKVISHSIVFISDDLKHDQHGVQHFAKTATHMLQQDGIKVKKVIQFSDGSPTQYKSKTNFTDCSYSVSDLGVSTEKHYFGSRHGKGPCDREIGVVKKSVNMLVAARQVKVSSPREFFEVCTRRLSQPRHGEDHVHMKRMFVYVPKTDVNRNRPTRTNVKPVKNTRRIHCVCGIGPMKIRVKERSCFCQSCRQGGICDNKELTGQWQIEKILPSQTINPELTQELPPADLEPSQDLPAANPESFQNFLADDPQPSLDLPAADPELPQHLPAADPEPSQNLPQVHPEPPKDLPANPEPPQHLPAADPEPPQHLPAADPEPSQDLPQVHPEPPKDLPANPEPPQHLPAADPEPSQDLPQVHPEPPKYLPANPELPQDLPAPDPKPPKDLPFANPNLSPGDVPPNKQSYSYGDYVQVTFSTLNRSGKAKTYLGLVQRVDSDSNEMEVSFLRKRQSYFIWPDVQDKAWVSLQSVSRRLPPPSIDARGRYMFETITD